MARQRGRRRAARSGSPSRSSTGRPTSQPRTTRREPVVLVVEDDRASVDLLTRLPHRQRLRRRRRPGRPDGLAAVRRERPDAVVLDIRLPGLDGWEVLAALKADPETAGHPRGRRVGAGRARRGAWQLGRGGVPREAGQPRRRAGRALASAVTVGAGRARTGRPGHEPRPGSSSSRTTTATSSWCATSWCMPASTWSRRGPGSRGSTLAPRGTAGPGADGPRTARASTAPRRCATCARVPRPRRRAGRRRHGVRDARRTGSAAVRAGFDGYLTKPIRRARPARAGARLPRGGEADLMTDEPTPVSSSSSTTRRRTAGCWTRC